jgi:hypothetical protein
MRLSSTIDDEGMVVGELIADRPSCERGSPESGLALDV